MYPSFIVQKMETPFLGTRVKSYDFREVVRSTGQNIKRPWSMSLTTSVAYKRDTEQTRYMHVNSYDGRSWNIDRSAVVISTAYCRILDISDSRYTPCFESD